MSPSTLAAVLLGIGGVGIANAAMRSPVAYDDFSDLRSDPPDFEIPIPIFSFDPTQGAADANLRAFLNLIRVAESSDNYRALVGGGEMQGFDGHPYYTEGFKGVPVSNGKRSYAAGAYQITRDTFDGLVNRHGFSRNDFYPDTQDRMAIELLRGRNALGPVKAGNFELAHELVRPEWEAFTLPRWNLDRSISVYQSLGGYVA